MSMNKTIGALALAVLVAPPAVLTVAADAPVRTAAQTGARETPIAAAMLINNADENTTVTPVQWGYRGYRAYRPYNGGWGYRPYYRYGAYYGGQNRYARPYYRPDVYRNPNAYGYRPYVSGYRGYGYRYYPRYYNYGPVWY